MRVGEPGMGSGMEWMMRSSSAGDYYSHSGPMVWPDYSEPTSPRPTSPIGKTDIFTFAPILPSSPTCSRSHGFSHTTRTSFHLLLHLRYQGIIWSHYPLHLPPRASSGLRLWSGRRRLFIRAASPHTHSRRYPLFKIRGEPLMRIA